MGAIDFDERFEGLAPAQRPTADAGFAIEREDGFLTAWDGAKLFWQGWRAPAEPLGCVALMHGYGEHSSRYDHVARAFARAGLDVWAIDARGHGRSEGRDAHIESYAEYVVDLEQLTEHARRRTPEVPLFVLGHSNGGLIALRYALRQPPDVAAWAVTSPMCRLKVAVPAWKEHFGRAMSSLWPAFTLPSGLPASDLTHDRAVVEAYKADPLVRSVTTARWFTEQRVVQDDLFERAHEITAPILMLVAGADRIVDAEIARRLFDRLGAEEKRFVRYDQMYHEILNELAWQEPAGLILDFFLARTDRGAR